MFEPRDISRADASRTRFRFQLTSLMDLLLIIVFAQFMEFRQASESARRESLMTLETRQQELESRFAEARRRAAEAQTRVAEAQTRVEEARERLERDRQALLDESAAVRASRNEAVARARESRRERDRVVETLSGLLARVTEGFSPQDSADDARRSVASAESLGRQLAESGTADLLRFLVGYEELLKRAEVWTLHASDRGDITVQGSGGEVSFRLEARDQRSRTEEFINQLRAASRTFPQPKGLVVVLASYSPLSIAGNYQPVIDGLPRAMEFLASDADERTRFEFAIVGALKDPRRDLTGPQPDVSDARQDAADAQSDAIDASQDPSGGAEPGNPGSNDPETGEPPLSDPP